MKKIFVYIASVFLFFSVVVCNTNAAGQATPDSTGSAPDTTVKAPDPAALIPPAAAPAPAKSNGSSVISMEFVKEKVLHSPDSTFFNILKITNTNGKSVSGTVKISVPLGWKVISDQDVNVTVQPGSTEIVPIRIALSRKVTGGVSYIINATLNSDRSLYSDKNQTSISKACYITVPEKVRWDVFPVSRSVYFDRYTEYAPMQLKLSNRGNGSQVVKLEFDIGSSLEMYGSLGRKYFASFEMKPNRDTIVTYNIKYLPEDGAESFNRDIRRFTIRIYATSDTVTRRTSVNFKYLESVFTNMLTERVYPLNIDVRLQNLLSEASPRLYLGIYGNVSLKKDRDITYSVRFPSVPFTGYNDPNFAENYLWRGSHFFARFRTPKWWVSAGDVSFPGVSLVGVGGRGVAGSYKLNSRNEIGGMGAVAVASPVYYAGIYHRILLPNNLDLNTSVTYVLNDYNKINNGAVAVQGIIPIKAGHRVTVLVSGSQSQHLYNNGTFVDASGNPIITVDPGAVFYGAAARVSYGMNLKKIRANINAGYASRHFSEYYNGRIDLNGNGQYTINKKYYLTGHSNFRIYDPTIYIQGKLRPYNRLENGTHKVDFANRINSRLTLFAGPVFDHYHLEQLRKTTTLDTVYIRQTGYSPKGALRLTYKNRANGSITPSLAIGRSYITRYEDSTLATTTLVSKKSFMTAQAGLNWVQGNWGLNVSYYYGPHSIATNSDYSYFNVYGKSLRIMPYFQKYFYNKTILLKSYNSYSYDALSNSERINLNATLSFFLEDHWSIFVDNNLFLTSRINSENEKVFARSYYLSLGVRKSFDIPQPGIKYYDLKVVCFKDINGNGILDGDEHGLSQIVITVDRNPQIDSITKKTIRQKGQFIPAEMITDNFGQVIYYQIPEGEFSLSVYPLMNLKDIYNTKGQKQKVAVTRDTTYYIPFVQTFRVTGSIIINRDQFTSGGSVSAANIRVVAMDSLGNSFPALSGSDGSYALYVPKAGKYKVSVNNVFGDQFILQEAEYEVSFDGAKEFHVDFIFNEKKRQMNVNGVPAPTATINTPTTTVATPTATATTNTATVATNTVTPVIVAGNDTLKNATLVSNANQPAGRDSRIPVGPGITYRIQLAASSRQVLPSQFEIAFKGLQNIQEYSEGGVYKYTAGDAATVDDAQKLKALAKTKGFNDAFIVPFYNGTRVRY